MIKRSDCSVSGPDIFYSLEMYMLNKSKRFLEELAIKADKLRKICELNDKELST